MHSKAYGDVVFVLPRLGDWCAGLPTGSPALACDGSVARRVHSGMLRAADVGFGAHPRRHVGVVQFESRPLRTDPGQLGEVVPRRRAAGGPLQRVAVSPRVVDGRRLAVAVALKMFHTNGSMDTPRVNAPIVETS